MYNKSESLVLHNARWFLYVVVDNASGNFNTCIPLKVLAQVFEDLKTK